MCWQHADITQMSDTSVFSAWWILIRCTHTHTHSSHSHQASRSLRMSPLLTSFLSLCLCLCLFLSLCIVSSLSSDLHHKLTDSAGSQRTKPLPRRPTHEDLSLQLPTGNPYTLVDIGKFAWKYMAAYLWSVRNSVPAKPTILFSLKIFQDEGEAMNYSQSASI